MNPTGQRIWVGQALIGLVCLMLAALVGRLVQIQTTMRPGLMKQVHFQTTAVISIPGRRGAILDRRHRVLAGSQDRPTVFADPVILNDRITEAVRVLGEQLGLPEEYVRGLLEKPRSKRYVVVQREVDKRKAERLLEVLGNAKLRGIGVQAEPVRTYPMGPLAAHVLGFMRPDAEGPTGAEGIEWACDRHLAAKPGRRVVFCDGDRRAVFQEEGSYEPPQDGLNVVLTLDAAIQEIVEREIQKAGEKFQADSALGVMMDPQTGEVLAMACWPAFDPARHGQAPKEALGNRHLTDPVEPGSIFKPFIMSVALAEGATHPGESIYCHDGLYVIGKRLLHDHKPFGHLTTEQVLTKSSNIGMAILGQRLGNERMHEGLKAFGFGRPTGIDLAGEGAGLLMPLKAWNSYSTTSVPMGHELAVTPMQIITGLCALVNGGRLLQPRVVAAVMANDGRVIEDRRQVRERGRAIDPETAETMRGIMVKVVNEGTGRPCQLDRWQVLGKTGTAQVPRKDRRGYEENAYLSSFMAAAPASDPAAAVLVMVRKPNVALRLGYHGSEVAAPAVKAILEQVLPYLNVPPDKTTGRDVHVVSRPGKQPEASAARQ